MHGVEISQPRPTQPSTCLIRVGRCALVLRLLAPRLVIDRPLPPPSVNGSCGDMVAALQRIVGGEAAGGRRGVALYRFRQQLQWLPRLPQLGSQRHHLLQHQHTASIDWGSTCSASVAAAASLVPCSGITSTLHQVKQLPCRCRKVQRQVREFKVRHLQQGYPWKCCCAEHVPRECAAHLEGCHRSSLQLAHPQLCLRDGPVIIPLSSRHLEVGQEGHQGQGGVTTHEVWNRGIGRGQKLGIKQHNWHREVGSIGGL